MKRPGEGTLTAETRGIFSAFAAPLPEPLQGKTMVRKGIRNKIGRPARVWVFPCTVSRSIRRPQGRKNTSRLRRRGTSDPPVHLPQPVATNQRGETLHPRFFAGLCLKPADQLRRDLVHWTELAPAIWPDELGTIFSGSAVVDWTNTAGFQSGDEKALIAIYTSAGNPFCQSIASSNDRGRTWITYHRNPILGHIAGRNRDPKVVWHAPSNRWIMALYLDKASFALFASPDLKEWTRLCDVEFPGS